MKNQRTITARRCDVPPSNRRTGLVAGSSEGGFRRLVRRACERSSWTRESREQDRPTTPMIPPPSPAVSRPAVRRRAAPQWDEPFNRSARSPRRSQTLTMIVKTKDADADAPPAVPDKDVVVDSPPSYSALARNRTVAHPHASSSSSGFTANHATNHLTFKTRNEPISGEPRFTVSQQLTQRAIRSVPDRPWDGRAQSTP